MNNQNSHICTYKSLIIISFYFYIFIFANEISSNSRYLSYFRFESVYIYKTSCQEKPFLFRYLCLESIAPTKPMVKNVRKKKIWFLNSNITTNHIASHNNLFFKIHIYIFKTHRN